MTVAQDFGGTVTLQDIGSVALIFSATGMILSAVFVGLQLHRTVHLFRIQQREARLKALADYKLLMLRPEVVDLMLRARADFGALSPAERIGFESLMEVAISSITSLHLNASASSVGKGPAQDFAVRHVASLVDHPGARAWWAERREIALVGGPGRALVDGVIGKDGRTAARVPAAI